jgi:YVTN family beta-propeller protein
VGVGVFPFSAVITPDSAFAYISNSTSGSVSVIDTTTHMVVGPPIGVGSNPQSFGVTPDGSIVLVAKATASGTVSLINTTTHMVVNTLHTGSVPNFIAVTSDGQFAYVPNRGNTNTVTVIDIPKQSVIATITVGQNPNQIAILNLPSPPASVIGVQIKNKFFAQTDVVNKITWTANTTGLPAVEYKIYRDASRTNLAGTVSACGPLEFLDHNRKKNVVYTYFIVAIDARGDPSDAGMVTVYP